MTAYDTWATTPLAEPPVYSVVIPAHNEEVRILPTIGAIASELCDLGQPWELIVSDDGSEDSTVSLLKGLGLANLKVIESPRTGKGGAVRRGVHAARGQYVLFADADQSTPVEQFSLLLEAIDSGADVAIGSRFGGDGEEQKRSLARAAVSGGLRLLVKFGFGMRIADTQCGFKMFTADAARYLFSIQKVDGFSFDFEVLFLATRAGMTIAEVPILWVDAPGSTVSPLGDSVRFLGDMVRIRWWTLRGRYRSTIPPPSPAPTSDNDALDHTLTPITVGPARESEYS